MTPRLGLQETPLANRELAHYADGSYAKNSAEKYQPWNAITTQHEWLESGVLPQFNTAQPAELFALTQACELTNGKTVNKYTNRRYAFGVVHEFGML